MKYLTTFTQNLLRSLGALVLIAAASSVASTMAQSSITLISGSGLGSRDAANQFTLDKGLTWQDAYVTPMMPNYHRIMGTRYIGPTATGRGYPDQTIRYRTTFQLPAGFSNPSLLLDIHADNAATIWLNGHLIGEQDQEEVERNFQNPAEQYRSTSAAQFVTGTNVLEFAIRNFLDPSGFDYMAIVSYTPAPTQVGIDIKPGEYPNSINLGSNGVVAVAILSSPSFDATQVDPLTVTLAGASVALRGRGTPMVSQKDVNDDGLLDLVVHVETEALELSEEDTQATLLGQTYGGLHIIGTDSVRIVP